MTPEELAAKAKAKQQQEEAAVAETSRRIDHFITSVSSLFDDIEEWMSPFFENGTASISRIKDEIYDETCDARYEIESAEITIVGKKITIKPEYLYGMGHSCSVAISGLQGKPFFIKKISAPNDWLLATKNILETTPLDEGSFMKLIEPLIA